MTFSFINIIDILGTFSFAAAGAFAAMERKLDPFGVLIIAFVTSVGGGTIRDVLIGDLPVAWLTNMTAMAVIITATVAALFFASSLKKMDTMLTLFDAMGLGLFTMIGIQKGIDHRLSMGVCVMLGTITGSFGGVLRDVLLNKVPLIFQKEIYASASIIGGVMFFSLLKGHVTENIASTIGILIVFIIRMMAVRFNWSLPKFYERKIKSH